MDFEILKAVGTTNERLREILTSYRPDDYNELSDEEKKAVDLKVEARERLQKRFQGKLLEHVNFSLRNHYLYSAVDLAWDSVPIHPNAYPLILYAQGKIKKEACAKSLSELGCANQFVKKDDQGVVLDIDLPKFWEVSVNLVRSFVTRRHAAQSNKYNNLWPHYKYEPRGTSPVAKLRSDLVSQRMDIMADDYDFKHHESQVMRDMLLYGHTVDFPRAAWERDREWVKAVVADEMEGEEVKFESRITREGLVFVNPHPTRVYWDNAYPLSSINSDTGCEYIGFWDVKRWKDVSKNPHYFNRSRVTYSSGVVSLFDLYAAYWSQAYCQIKAPPAVTDLAGWNDRKSNVGLYGSDLEDTSVFVAEHFDRIIPKEYGIGDYPYPVWIRFTLAGEDTPIDAEIYPSRPAAYCGLNESDSRQVNLSFAHEIMPYQDQMTNLQSQMLMVAKNAQMKFVLIDIDTVDGKNLEEVRKTLKGDAYYVKPIGVEFSGTKLRELGINQVNPVRVVETADVAQQINVLFQAMVQLVGTVERLTAMSPNESGQPAPREISATEVNEISATTTTVYSFISDAIDEYRAAKKRICFESWMACGSNNLRLPSLERYSEEVVKAAGFEIEDTGEEGYFDETTPRDVRNRTVIGSKTKLLYDYIFTSRDGSERPSNTQAANVLVQMLAGVVGKNSQVLQSMGKEKLFELINEIVRLSSNYDLKLGLTEGEPNSFAQAMPEEAAAVPNGNPKPEGRIGGGMIGSMGR